MGAARPVVRSWAAAMGVTGRLTDWLAVTWLCDIVASCVKNAARPLTQSEGVAGWPGCGVGERDIGATTRSGAASLLSRQELQPTGTQA